MTNMVNSSYIKVSVVETHKLSSFRQQNHCNLFLPLRNKSERVVCCLSNGNGFPQLLTERTVVKVAQDQTLLSHSSTIQEDIEALEFMSYPQRKMELGSNQAERCGINECGEGIGITKFLKGKQFLITGATGFLAKVLIEKLLRSAPDVGKIYLLIKAKDQETASKRLKNEIINSELFQCLKGIHGDKYEDFMLSKLVPVLGDVNKANVGIEYALADEISEEVDVIINSAANTSFDERYDVSVDINSLGPWRLMSYAQRFKQLRLFLHISTAYVNGQRKGRILEKPFCVGDTIARETTYKEPAGPMLDVIEEIKLAFSSGISSQDSSSQQEMKDMGSLRAKMYGWQDSYVFTKAMGEMIINCMRGNIPVVTIRPSVIESTYKEPFPGWMEGNRMMDPIILHYGKGQLTGFLADPTGVLDVVPADIVVNATLAALAKHGSYSTTHGSGMHVYHVASSVVNPLVFQDLANILYEHFTATPWIDSRGKPIQVSQMKLFTDMHEFSSYVSNDATQRCERLVEAISHEKLAQRLKAMCMKSVDQAKYLANIYQPYTLYAGRFDNTNTQHLMSEISEEDRDHFNFDVEGIDWNNYISKIHIPGLRRHVMKERNTSTSGSIA